MKSSYFDTLLKLLILGAKKPIKISTFQLAEQLSKSQQSASHHLLYLEKFGYIERFKDIDGNLLQITDKGLSYLTNLYHQLQIAFEKHSFLFEGTVFSGLGEGAYYVSLSGYKKQFISKLNFEPFPGTLNLRLINPIYRKMKLRLSNSLGIHINGFTDKKRTFGSAKCFPALINNKENGAVLVIERTHYDNSVLELISTVNLRKKLQLKDGHSVTVNVL